MKNILLKDIGYFDRSFRYCRGDIRIEGSRIKAISPPGSDSKYSDEIIAGCDYLAAPGFVNAHFHSQTTLCLGLIDAERSVESETASVREDLNDRFIDWVDETGDEDQFVSLCLQSYAELLRNGVTTTQDSGYGERDSGLLRGSLERLGMRGVIDAYGRVHERLLQTTELVGYGGHLPEEEDLVKELNEAINLTRGLPARLFTHSLETTERRNIAIRDFGKSSLAVFEEAGLLDERCVLFHVVHADAEDLDRIARTGAHVVHCPISNARHGTGIAPIRDMVDREINVALGTDWASANQWENMRLAWYLANITGTGIASSKIWHMATRGGAIALDLDTGEIAPGRLADLMLIDLAQLELQPLVDDGSFSTLAHNLMLEGDSRLVESVMVGGKWVYREGRLVNFDERDLNKTYRAISAAIFGETEYRSALGARAKPRRGSN